MSGIYNINSGVTSLLHLISGPILLMEYSLHGVMLEGLAVFYC